MAQIDEMAEDLGTRYRRGISRAERGELVSILQRLRENLRALEVEEFEPAAPR